MNLVWITNTVDPRRAPTLAALARKASTLAVVETSRFSAPEVIQALWRHRPHAIVVENSAAGAAAGALWCALDRRCRLLMHAGRFERAEAPASHRVSLRDLRRVGTNGLSRLLLHAADTVLVGSAGGARRVEALGVSDARIDYLPFATDVARLKREADAGATGEPRAESRGDKDLALSDAAGDALPHDEIHAGTVRLLHVGAADAGLVGLIVALAGAAGERRQWRIVLRTTAEVEPSQAVKDLPPNLVVERVDARGSREVAALHRQADLFALPTLSACWDTAVNDAMARGLPVLGSDRNEAVAELVRNGASGWVFDPLDPESVRATLERVFATPRPVWRTMGERARERALALSPDAVAERVLGVCVTLVDQPAI